MEKRTWLQDWDCPKCDEEFRTFSDEYGDPIHDEVVEHFVEVHGMTENEVNEDHELFSSILRNSSIVQLSGKPDELMID